MMGRDLSLGLDPVRLAQRAGITPDDWQADLLRARDHQVIMNASRQSGKSSVSALLALDEVLHRPPALALLLAPALRQSQELFRKVKQYLQALGYPVPIVQESALALELANGSRIVSLPGSDDATIRGYSSVALLVVDEAARTRDDLLYAATPMLAVSKGRTVLLSTPWGKRGAFHHIWNEGGPAWKRVLVTAEQCPRITPEYLEQERAAMPDHRFRAEYMCEFLDDEMSVFDYDLVAGALTDDVKPLFPITGRAA
jgi:hypothetical protein